MTRDRVLPRAKHLAIIVLLNVDTSLVLDFGEFRSAFLIHTVLQVAPHRAVTLTYLTKHVRLMSLLFEGLLQCTLFMGLCLAFNILIDHPLVVLLEPICLLLHRLLQKDVLLAVLIHVLKQVDTGLVLSAPLLLTSIPLLLVFNLGKIINHLLVGLLVRLGVLVVRLEFLDFVSSSHSLLQLDLLNSTLTIQCSAQEHLVTVSFNLLGLLTELLLHRVVLNELEVALAIKQKLLVSVLLLFLLFNGPLLAEHDLLLGYEALFLLALHSPRVLLPVEHSHRVLDLLLLLAGLGHLALELLLGIQLPELGIDLFFHHLALDVAPLVNQLLLALNGSSIVVEFSVFLSQSVVLGLEFHVLTAGNLV